MSTVRFEGKLVQTTKKPITEECFNDLIANGRESSFYPFVRQITSDDIIQNGFELTDKKVSSVEGFHDDESLDLTETLHKDYQVTYLPITRKGYGFKDDEGYFYIREVGFLSGSLELELDDDFDKSKLTFEVQRVELVKGTVVMYLNPRYDKQVFDVHRSWDSSWFENESLIGSKGQLFSVKNQVSSTDNPLT